LERIIQRAKVEGTYDNAVMEVKGYIDVPPKLVYSDPNGAITEYIEVKVDRGITWEQSQVTNLIMT